LRAAGDPGGLPGLVGRMLGAVDGESAREACGRIESNVCPNRMLYGAAEAVVAHIVSALGSGGEVSERPDPDPDASARRAGHAGASSKASPHLGHARRAGCRDCAE